jgi:predicted negative regulator of RcsB-dependent stress response
MIKNFLITDSTGIALYSKNVNSAKEISTQLFSGLISTVGTVGKMLFKQKLATITFGSDVNENQVVILSKDRYGDQKSIYFVFAGNHLENTIPLKEIAATLYIEAKKELMNPQSGDLLKQKINNLLENRFHNLTEI